MYKHLSSPHKCLLPLILMILVSLFSNIILSNTLYLENKTIKFTPNSRFVGAYVVLKPLKFIDYDYALIIFTGKGVFAYGYYLEKRQNIQEIRLYRVSGDQNRWFYLKSIRINETVLLLLILDLEERVVYFRINNTTIEDVIVEDFTPRSFNIIVSNIDKYRSPPKIAVKTLVVFQTNQLDIRLVKEYRNKQILAFLEKQSIIYKASTDEAQQKDTIDEVTSTITPNQNITSIGEEGTSKPVGKQYSLRHVLILIVITIVLAGTFMLIRRIKRSHGP